MRDYILHRKPGYEYPRTEQSQGSYIAQIDNEDPMAPMPHVLDISSGAGVTLFGHSEDSIKRAMIDQIHKLPYAHAGQWEPTIVQQAAEQLLQRSGVAFEGGGVTFFSGGAEAVEAACKIALQVAMYENYYMSAEPFQQPARFIARQHSYHGGSLFALELGDHQRKSFLTNIAGYSPNVLHFKSAVPHLQLQDPKDLDAVSALYDASVTSLRDMLIRDHENENPSIVVIETVMGTTVGISAPIADYLADIRQVCNEFEAILIYDEILSGNYRTGCFAAWQYYQKQISRPLAPDIMVVGKGITGGYFPMSAVIVNEHVRGTIEAIGSMNATSTNQNHPVGAAACVAAMEAYDKLNYGHEVRDFIVRHAIRELLECDLVDSVHGVGSLWGVTLNSVGAKSEKVKQQLLKSGVTCYADNVRGRVMLLFAPPLNASEFEMRSFVQRIRKLKL